MVERCVTLALQCGFESRRFLIQQIYCSTKNKKKSWYNLCRITLAFSNLYSCASRTPRPMYSFSPFPPHLRSISSTYKQKTRGGGLNQGQTFTASTYNCEIWRHKEDIKRLVVCVQNEMKEDNAIQKKTFSLSCGLVESYITVTEFQISTWKSLQGRN